MSNYQNLVFLFRESAVILTWNLQYRSKIKAFSCREVKFEY